MTDDYRKNAAVDARISNACRYQQIYMGMWAASTIMYIFQSQFADIVALGWVSIWIIYVIANDADPSRPRKGWGWGLLGLIGLFFAQVLIVVLVASTQVAYLIGGGG